MPWAYSQISSLVDISAHQMTHTEVNKSYRLFYVKPLFQTTEIPKWAPKHNLTSMLRSTMRIKDVLNDDVIKWNHFRITGPYKGQWRGSLMFYLICAWTNGWASNRDAGDLKRHGARSLWCHCNVVVNLILLVLFVLSKHSIFQSLTYFRVATLFLVIGIFLILAGIFIACRMKRRATDLVHQQQNQVINTRHAARFLEIPSAILNDVISAPKCFWHRSRHRPWEENISNFMFRTVPVVTWYRSWPRSSASSVITMYR